MKGKKKSTNQKSSFADRAGDFFSHFKFKNKVPNAQKEAQMGPG